MKHLFRRRRVSNNSSLHSSSSSSKISSKHTASMSIETATGRCEFDIITNKNVDLYVERRRRSVDTNSTPPTTDNTISFQPLDMATTTTLQPQTPRTPRTPRTINIVETATGDPVPTAATSSNDANPCHYTTLPLPAPVRAASISYPNQANSAANDCRLSTTQTYAHVPQEPLRQNFSLELPRQQSGPRAATPNAEPVDDGEAQEYATLTGVDVKLNKPIKSNIHQLPDLDRDALATNEDGQEARDLTRDSTRDSDMELDLTTKSDMGVSVIHNSDTLSNTQAMEKDDINNSDPDMFSSSHSHSLSIESHLSIQSQGFTSYSAPSSPHSQFSAQLSRTRSLPNLNSSSAIYAMSTMTALTAPLIPTAHEVLQLQVSTNEKAPPPRKPLKVISLLLEGPDDNKLQRIKSCGDFRKGGGQSPTKANNNEPMTAFTPQYKRLAQSNPQINHYTIDHQKLPQQQPQKLQKLQKQQAPQKLRPQLQLQEPASQVPYSPTKSPTKLNLFSTFARKVKRRSSVLPPPRRSSLKNTHSSSVHHSEPRPPVPLLMLPSTPSRSDSQSSQDSQFTAQVLTPTSQTSRLVSPRSSESTLTNSDSEEVQEYYNNGTTHSAAQQQQPQSDQRKPRQLHHVIGLYGAEDDDECLFQDSEQGRWIEEDGLGQYAANILYI